MTATRDLLTGLRDLLAKAAQAPGYVGALPYEVDECFSLSYTNVSTDPSGRWARGVLMLQTRGAAGIPLSADDLAEQLVAILIRTAGLALGSVTVAQCVAGASSRGLDSSKRSVRADRLDIDLDYPA